MKTLPMGWIETKLGDIANVVTDYVANGSFASLKENVTYKQEKNFARLIRLVDYNKNYKGDAIYVDENSYNFLKKSQLEPNDIIISNVGEYSGTVFRAPSLDIPMTLGPNAILVKFSNDDFMYYFFKSNIGQHLLNTIKSGSANPKFNKTDFKKIKLIIPESPDEQKEIASILSSFDKKIELLKEQNQTLETMAQTIFKEWFVDFNYPNATDEMIDSEMGEIPKGWRVGKIGDEFDITIGRTPPRQESQWFSEIPKGMKWASIKDMGNAGVYIFNTSEYIVDEAIVKFNIPIIPENTTILSFKMTVGKVSITAEKMLSNEAIAHMKIKKDSYLTSEYIYLFLLNLNFNTLGSTSSIVTAINTAIIKKIRFLVPDKNSMNNFSNLIIPIFTKIKNNSKQIQTLEKTRDSLLPKLMSGQKRVFEYDN